MIRQGGKRGEKCVESSSEGGVNQLGERGEALLRGGTVSRELRVRERKTDGDACGEIELMRGRR